jgi:hypothetical protein
MRACNCWKIRRGFPGDAVFLSHGTNERGKGGTVESEPAFIGAEGVRLLGS